LLIKAARSIFLLALLLATSTSGCRAKIAGTRLPSATEVQAQTELPAPGDTPLPQSSTPVPTSTPALTARATAPPNATPAIRPTFSPQTLSFAAGEPIKIGYLLWESDPTGIDSRRAIELAIRDFGGELLRQQGHPIELVGFDEGCRELGGLPGAQLLARDAAVVGVIGTSCSSSVKSTIPIISDAGKVLISPSNTSPALTEASSRSPGYFRTAPNEIFQVNAVAEFAFNEPGKRKMATVYNAIVKSQTASSKQLCQAFANLGGECVLEWAFQRGVTHVTPVINAILESGADSIYLAIDLPVAATFIEEVRANPGLKDATVFVEETMNTPEFLREAGDNAVGVYVSTTSRDFDRGSVAYQSFLERYRSQFGEDPVSESHAFAYDAAYLLLNAIAAVAVSGQDGTLRVDPLAVRDILYRLDLPGLTGLLSCSPQGDCTGVTGGRVYQYKSGDPATFNPGTAGSPRSNPAQVWP
jgi:branched-chain amino acid transport system substrate-binding protein